MQSAKCGWFDINIVDGCSLINKARRQLHTAKEEQTNTVLAKVHNIREVSNSL